MRRVACSPPEVDHRGQGNRLPECQHPDHARVPARRSRFDATGTPGQSNRASWTSKCPMYPGRRCDRHHNRLHATATRHRRAGSCLAVEAVEGREKTATHRRPSSLPSQHSRSQAPRRSGSRPTARRCRATLDREVSAHNVARRREATITITPSQVCWKFSYHELDTERFRYPYRFAAGRGRAQDVGAPVHGDDVTTSSARRGRSGERPARNGSPRSSRSPVASTSSSARRSIRRARSAASSKPANWREEARPARRFRLTLFPADELVEQSACRSPDDGRDDVEPEACMLPETTAGPIDRAGFIDRPETGPPEHRVEPDRRTDGDRRGLADGSRSVATARTTNIRNGSTTSSEERPALRARRKRCTDVRDVERVSRAVTPRQRALQDLRGPVAGCA